MASASATIGLLLFSKLQFSFFNQNKIRISGNDSIEEISIKSERFMFSPMFIRLKRGKAVKLVLSTYDVQHGITQSDLKIYLSAYPGKPSETVIIPDKIGEYTTTCSLYCGVDHNKMKMTFVVGE